MRFLNFSKLMTLAGIGFLFSIPTEASAQFPTFDIAAIKEGITSNLELVKQSKIVTEATATAGKINAGIGNAKASMSKFAGDNLAKAQEKMEKIQKEKERLEKKKEKYEKYKEQLEEKKKQLEEAKARVEQAKQTVNDAKDKVNDVREKVNDVKDMAADVKELAGDIKSEAQSKVGAAKKSAGIASDNRTSVPVPTSDNKIYEEPEISAEPAVAEEAAVEASGEEAEEAATSEEGTEPSAEELKAEESALIKEKAALEVDAMLAKTPEEKAAIEAKKAVLDEKIQAFDARKEAAKAAGTSAGEPEKASAGKGRRPFGTDALKNKKDDSEAQKPKSAEKESSAEKENETQSHRAKILDGETSTKMEIPEAHRPKILDGETSTKMEIPESHRPKILDEAEKSGAAKSSGGFRKRARSADLNMLSKQRFARSFEERLAFGQLNDEEIPDGMQDGVFILSDRMATECGINVKDLEDPQVIDDCIKKLVALKTNKVASTAAEGQAVYNAIMQETVNALIAESMNQKNVAATYEENVLKKLEEDIANAKNSRDDTSGLTMTNKEHQFLLNRILTVYAASVSLNALQQVGGFDSSYYSQDGSESGEGE